jgi:hypothetical protein
MRTLSDEVSGLKEQIAAGLRERTAEQLSTRFDELRKRSFGSEATNCWASRDGFQGKEFHRRCDGHTNTLTVILDMKGNIFGGFTPVEWESPAPWKWKADDSQKRYVFTLKNPQQHPGEEICVEGRKEARGHLV